MKKTGLFVCLFVYLAMFYVLTTSEGISGREPACDSGQSWRLYSAALLGNQILGTMTQ